MPLNPPVSLIPNTYNALNIILDAMIEVGILAPGEDNNADPGVVQWAFRKLNYLLDEWAADEIFVYSVAFQLFTLIANHPVHTIGPGTAQLPADFPVVQRPVKIVSASLLLNNNVDTPIDVEDDQWWASNPVKTLSSSLPTHVYYSPDNPNGNLFFWPVTSVVYPVRLELWTLLSQFSEITDPVDGPGGQGILPPAYRAALMLTLAEALGGDPPDNLADRAKRARAAIMGNNMEAPRITTVDAGMPEDNSRPRFNFLTREPYR